jgi:hypothetical protein
MIDPATGWFEIVKATNKSATFIQKLFHITWLARYPQQPQFIVFDNANVGIFNCEFKQMCLKSNQIQVTTHKQMQSLSDVSVVKDMLRSFDLEINHENLEEQQDNPFDYFLQSTAWLPGY